MGLRLRLLRRRSRAAADARAADLTLRHSLFPLCLVTVLFFLWGFSYGLLDTLNKHFQTVLHIDRARSAGLQAAYFGAYPLASIGHAAWILRHFGYRATFIWGLCLYALGALLAIPALKAASFAGFCACIFVIGNGIASLEAAANPYISVCGPPRLSVVRINTSQAFNGVGAVIAPVLGSYVFFNFSDQHALENVQWVYLAIAVFVLVIASAFVLAHIPEISDADMAMQAKETVAPAPDEPFRRQYRLFHAAFAQFCYTGAQVAIASFFINYATATRPNTDPALGAKLFAGAMAAFAVGRFVGTGLMQLVRPRIVLLAFLTGCVVFIAPAISQRGNVGVAMLYLVLFFESVCFPTIVALGIRGLGRHTKRGSGYIIAGVVGAACAPPLTGVAGDRHGDGVAMVVPMVFFLGAWSYAFCVNFVPAYRRVVDSFDEPPLRLSRRASADGERSASADVERSASADKAVALHVGHGIALDHASDGEPAVPR